MITAQIHVIDTSEINGERSTLIDSVVRSVGSFVADSSSALNIKMEVGKSLKLSDIVEITSVTGLVIVSSSDTLNTFPLFDISYLSYQDSLVATQRLSQFYLIGISAGSLSNDILIDNLEVIGANPKLSILIFTS